MQATRAPLGTCSCPKALNVLHPHIVLEAAELLPHPPGEGDPVQAQGHPKPQPHAGSTHTLSVRVHLKDSCFYIAEGESQEEQERRESRCV